MYKRFNDFTLHLFKQYAEFKLITGYRMFAIYSEKITDTELILQKSQTISSCANPAQTLE